MRRLLIADDDAGAREMLGHVVQDIGLEVDPVASGEEAIAKLEEGRKYDLVLTDLKMPGMSGLDLVREVKTRDPSMEVIVLTGYPSVDTAVEAVKSGAYDYIIKPFRVAEARLAIGRALEKRALGGEARFFKALFLATLLSLPFWGLVALIVWMLAR